jgi:hypothetical protein
MQERSWRAAAAALVCGLLLAVASARGGENKKPIPVTEVPADVIKAAEKLCPGGQVTEAVREDDVDDQGDIEEFDFEMKVTVAGGKVHEVEVDTTPDGKVKPSECEARGPVDAADLPAAVADAIKRLCPDGKVASGERRGRLRGEQAEFEYQLKLDLAADEKAEVRIRLAGDGKIRETRLEADVPAADLPKVVGEALKLIRPGGRIVSARKETRSEGEKIRVEYDLKLETADGQGFEADIRLTADGRIRRIEIQGD